MSDLPTGRISNLRVWFAELLCKPLAMEIVRLQGRMSSMEGHSHVLQETLSGISTDLNDLRNQITNHPSPLPPPHARVARTWQEFRTAAESRKPKEQKS